MGSVAVMSCSCAASFAQYLDAEPASFWVGSLLMTHSPYAWVCLSPSSSFPPQATKERHIVALTASAAADASIFFSFILLLLRKNFTNFFVPKRASRNFPGDSQPKPNKKNKIRIFSYNLCVYVIISYNLCKSKYFRENFLIKS